MHSVQGMVHVDASTTWGMGHDMLGALWGASLRRCALLTGRCPFGMALVHRQQPAEGGPVGDRPSAACISACVCRSA